MTPKLSAGLMKPTVSGSMQTIGERGVGGREHGPHRAACAVSWAVTGTAQPGSAECSSSLADRREVMQPKNAAPPSQKSAEIVRRHRPFGDCDYRLGDDVDGRKQN